MDSQNDLLLDEDLREEIAARLDLMLRDARKGDGVILGVLGKTLQAELMRVITPIGARGSAGYRRPVLALQMGLSVDAVREIRTLVFQAVNAFTPENRQPAIAILTGALAQWRRM
jgi:hypothetical protein